ncbi:MAG: hypothetical protein M1837_003755 [Sclerophora amabilis]|nr:MAG: hypothetical protein M1837_003755 [Sclerophora amabilis]
MAASTSAASYRPSPGPRPALPQTQSGLLPASPHTPTRNFASLISSPSTSLRGDEECLVIEFGSRYMRAGFAGENVPRCVLGFGPNEQRRVGDYRQWEMGYEDSWRRRKRKREWSEPHELWRMDLRGVDLGLVEDKIERAVRTAFTKFLLTDSKPRRVLLALPPDLPHGLISTLLTTLFTNFQSPSITLISTPVLTTVAAGVRSALVVDIGWHETVITGVFEYREISCSRSIRARKMVTQEMGKLLARQVRRARNCEDPLENQDEPKIDAIYPNEISFEECEEVIARLGWTRSGESNSSYQSDVNAEQTSAPQSLGVSPQPQPMSLRSGSDTHSNDSLITIPLLSTQPPTTLNLPFAQLSTPVEVTFFPQDLSSNFRSKTSATGRPSSPSNRASHPFDEDELPLPQLAYRALLCLPIDIRSTCVSRIIITGGGSTIPGVKSRLIAELQSLINESGWARVRGPTTITARNKKGEDGLQQPQKPEERGAPKSPTPNGDPAIPPSQQEPESDPITALLQSRTDANPQPTLPPGIARGVESLGSWAGGSLVAGLRIKGAVEIERERYLSGGGLAGATWPSKEEGGAGGGGGGVGGSGSRAEEMKGYKGAGRGVIPGKVGNASSGAPGGAAAAATAAEKGAWSLGTWG